MLEQSYCLQCHWCDTLSTNCYRVPYPESQVFPYLSPTLLNPLSPNCYPESQLLPYLTE